MSLPSIETFAFPVTVPSTGKTVAIRPFLVREEKLLLMAQESQNLTDQVDAVAQLIRNCTNGEVEPRRTPFFDIEYLIIQLRARSVGENTSPIYQCHHVLEGGTSCDHKTPIPVNLLDINVSGLDRNPDKFLVRLSDRYTLKLRYPTIYTVHELAVASIPEQTHTHDFMVYLCDIFDTVTDETTGKVDDFEDTTIEERLAFLESISPRKYEEIIDFLGNLPTVQHTITYTCERCGFVHTLVLSGVMDFLA